MISQINVEQIMSSSVEVNVTGFAYLIPDEYKVKICGFDIEDASALFQFDFSLTCSR